MAYIKIGGIEGKEEKSLQFSYRMVMLAVAFAFVVFLLYSGHHLVMVQLLEAAHNISARTGWSFYLIRGLLLIISIPLLFVMAIQDPKEAFTDALNLQFSRSSKKALLLTFMLAGYTAGYLVILGLASRSDYAYEFCADTPEGIATSDTAGGKDPIYGKPFHPCTESDIRVLRSTHDHKLLSANEVAIPDWHHIHRVDPITGMPTLWYSQRADGFHFFNRAGTDPEGGADLKPVTQRVVTEYQASQKALEDQQLAIQTQQADTLFVTSAQKSFDTGDFKSALDACTTVLGHGANPACEKIKEDSSVQLAHKFVDEGQVDLQRGQYDDAIRSAKQATELDPDNVPAKNLLQVAHTLKLQASVN